MGIKSHFYFMASDNKLLPREYRYSLKSKLFREKINEIKIRDHLIGFHPGYYTYNDENRWSYEKELLEEAVNDNIVEGRQHYLRMDITKTLNIWNKHQMIIDSTLGYADIEGFRCGTGDIFYLFDIINRRQMNIMEQPLIVMDGTLFDYQQYSLDKATEILNYFILIGKKYNSRITLLFHNNTIDTKWNGSSSLLFKSIIDLISA
jgi:hypothetical protein